MDEIHRFNRSQQDGFLPYVEDGTVTLVGATTENPSFELNAALLSRCQVLILRRLDHEALDELIAPRRGARGPAAAASPPEAREALIASADGDGRFLLNQAETLFSVEIAEPLGPAELGRAAPPPRAGLRQGPRGPLQPHLGASQKRSAGRTRRPRFIISRGCWSPARSRSTCSAG